MKLTSNCSPYADKDKLQIVADKFGLQLEIIDEVPFDTIVITTDKDLTPEDTFKIGILLGMHMML